MSIICCKLKRPPPPQRGLLIYIKIVTDSTIQNLLYYLCNFTKYNFSDLHFDWKLLPTTSNGLTENSEQNKRT